VKTTMIVDDTALTRGFLRDMLESLGLKVVVETESGEEAVKQFMLFRPDLVAVDVSTPAMDELAVVKKIRKIDGKAKIIVCSAVVQRDAIMRTIDAGASDFLAKPLQKDRVAWAIQHLKEIG